MFVEVVDAEVCVSGNVLSADIRAGGSERVISFDHGDSTSVKLSFLHVPLGTDRT